MASTQNPTTSDTPINLKVTIDGVVKKVKLPLRDMGASSLERKLREHLNISTETDCRIERYSDSAAEYILLDAENASVYKQLFRAAKAKQKLKLRLTTIKPEEPEEQPAESQPEVASELIPAQESVTQSTRQPKAVTVEDEPETTSSPVPAPPRRHTTMPVPPPAWTPTVPAPAPATRASTSNSWEWKADPLNLQLDAQIKHMQDNHAALEKHISRLEASISAPRVRPVCSLPIRSQQPRQPSFAVHCNSCDKVLPSFHYHCQTCDDGDFDLCQKCVNLGITCYGTDHWLIKRFVENGAIINSTTEKVAPKTPAQRKEPTQPVYQAPFGPLSSATDLTHVEWTAPAPKPVTPFDFGQFAGTQVHYRTCNNCVIELPEAEFLHCTTCRDFDLCKPCFSKNDHGHHPKHGFIPAVEGGALSADVSRKLAPGRNQKHNAVCDGCDKYVTGVRHKCLECPDWDYCSDCIANASFIHPDHRFVPIYEPLAEVRRTRPSTRMTHYGICCDGPLCNNTRGGSPYISGERYKCTICHDTDFCANCEASPANTHNKTHPLIKFKTPVRHVSVTTTGEHVDGKRMPSMGDRTAPVFSTTMQSVDVKPAEPAPVPVVKAEEKIVKTEEKEIKVEDSQPEPVQPTIEKAAPQPTADDLVAVYQRETVTDGTVFPPNHVFEQTWVLRNAGTTTWPAGCSVKFVGGDYMGHVDPNRVAPIKELVSASESTISYEPLLPGQEFPFTVLLRTPSREGKVISYWRLQTKEGLKFGHRLWCDVEVKSVKKEESKPAPVEPKREAPSPAPASVASTEQSQMIFPKLEKESPVASIHEEAKSETTTEAAEEQVADDFEEDDEWNEELSQDGFMTDDEYDILDASDEEYLEDEQKKVAKK